MQQITTFRRTLLAAVISGASLLLAVPAVTAATATDAKSMPAKRAAAAALSAAQRDFAQFVAHQVQRKGGAPADFPLEVSDIRELKNATISHLLQLQAR